MKVLVLGQPRTGTQSMAEALEMLGIAPVYHMRDVGKKNHEDLWGRALEATFENKGHPWGRADFEQVFTGCEGVADIPAAIFAEELVKAYPEAAIILSTRSEDAWYNSMMNTIVHHHVRRLPDSSPLAILATKVHKHCWDNDFPSNGLHHFRQHNETVKRIAKGRKFLEYDVRQGWEPLCEFLGVPVPDRPFPRVDDWIEYKREVERSKSE